MGAVANGGANSDRPMPSTRSRKEYDMDRVTQQEVARRLFTYLDTRSTAMDERVSLEPVRAYVGLEQAALERQRFFRAHPLILALSCEVARPGDFLTQDLTGVPILV